MKTIKQIITVVAMAIFMLSSFSGNAQNKKSLVLNNSLDLNAQKSEITKNFSSELLKDVSDIYSYSMTKVDNKTYIVGIGKTINDNSITFRQEIEISEVKNGSKFASQISFTGEGESCTGNPCTRCWFAEGGGCGCGGRFSTGKCNHTVSKPTISAKKN